MQGIELTFDAAKNVVVMTITKAALTSKLTSKILTQEIEREYSDLDIIPANELNEIIKDVTNKDNESPTITSDVAYKRDAHISISTSDDGMTASLFFRAAYGGKTPTLQEVVKMANMGNVVRGIDEAAIEDLLNKAPSMKKGAETVIEFAHGIPPQNGSPSIAKPLFENIQERILRPQEKDHGKVDMREFGSILMVKPGTPVLEYLPPTDGVTGYKVDGTTVPPSPGEWQAKQVGPGTEFAEDNDCLLIATQEGIPKFENGIVSIEDVFIISGCNVATGNVKYEGDVLITGDVTEQMVVESSGNVTIAGFVESATIKAGGSITIAKGASGRVEEDLTQSNCHLYADGDIHIQRGRGLIIKSSGNVTIGKELAFSTVTARGDIIAGDGDVPAGTIYASRLIPMQKVRAGKLGAVSGSRLTIDFTASLLNLETKVQNLTNLSEKLNTNVVSLSEKLKLFANKQLNEQQKAAFIELKKIYSEQRKTAARIEHELKRNQQLEELFTSQIGVQTYAKLYPGVRIQLNKKVWESKDELSRAQITFVEDKWQYEPLIN